MKFTVKKIESILVEEAAQCPAFREYGLSPDNMLNQLVLPPRSTRFRNAEGMKAGYRWLWVVFDETPSSERTGFWIVYDPRVEQYGLASKPHGKRWGSFIGFYGNFCETLEAMLMY